MCSLPAPLISSFHSHLFRHPNRTQLFQHRDLRFARRAPVRTLYDCSFEFILVEREHGHETEILWFSVHESHRCPNKEMHNEILQLLNYIVRMRAYAHTHTHALEACAAPPVMHNPPSSDLNTSNGANKHPHRPHRQNEYLDKELATSNAPGTNYISFHTKCGEKGSWCA